MEAQVWSLNFNHTTIAQLQHKVRACNINLLPTHGSPLKQHKLEPNIPIHKAQFDGGTKLDPKYYRHARLGSKQHKLEPKIFLHVQRRAKAQFNRGTKLTEEQSYSLQYLNHTIICSLAAKNASA